MLLVGSILSIPRRGTPNRESPFGLYPKNNVWKYRNHPATATFLPCRRSNDRARGNRHVQRARKNGRSGRGVVRSGRNGRNARLGLCLWYLVSSICFGSSGSSADPT